VKAPNLTLV